ncbi:hypothetical protein VR46_41190 [Streptomyces sp. NRRL S-444]|nr:hypothetical protein VR46_41190 [Streptomyces sp. NRRL S-444]
MLVRVLNVRLSTMAEPWASSTVVSAAALLFPAARSGSFEVAVATATPEMARPAAVGPTTTVGWRRRRAGGRRACRWCLAVMVQVPWLGVAETTAPGPVRMSKSATSVAVRGIDHRST